VAWVVGAWAAVVMVDRNYSNLRPNSFQRCWVCRNESNLFRKFLGKQFEQARLFSNLYLCRIFHGFDQSCGSHGNRDILQVSRHPRRSHNQRALSWTPLARQNKNLGNLGGADWQVAPREARAVGPWEGWVVAWLVAALLEEQLEVAERLEVVTKADAKVGWQVVGLDIRACNTAHRRRVLQHLYQHFCR